MKTYNHLFQTMEQFCNYLDGIEFDRSRKVLLRIHSSVHTCEKMEALASEMQDVLPNATIIGCSTNRVICEGKLIKDSCLVSISEFEQCEMEAQLFECIDEKGGEKSGKKLCDEVSRQLIRGREGFLLIFLSMVYTKGMKFVEQMNQKHPGVRMLGGGAYCEDKPHHANRNGAYVLLQNRISYTGVAAVFLESQQLSVYCGMVCGVESVGRSYKITKTHRHYIDEVEGIDGAEWYAGLLGKEELEKDPVLSQVFPVVKDCEESQRQIPFFVDYEPVHKNGKNRRKKRLNLCCALSKGMDISIGYFNPQKISSQMGELYQTIRKTPVEAVFAYDCQSRMWMLNGCANWEVGQFYTTNMSGALLSGEIAYVENQNIYSNYTFVVAGCSEHEEARILLKNQSFQNVVALQQDNVQLVNYLLATGNQQLNEQLSRQKAVMKRAVFHNEALDMDNHLGYLFDCEENKYDKIALFSLNNEKMLKIFVGHRESYKELKRLYSEVDERILNETGALLKGKIHLYSYEATSLLVAAQPDVEERMFLVQMKKIFAYLNKVVLGEVPLSYECAVVVHEKEALQKAESTIRYGLEHKIPFVVYHEIAKERMDIKEEMHILQVIKDALSKDWIVPYFQGIYDNQKKKITLYEALMRIRDDQGRVYYPNQFLGLAKEYKLYESISVLMVKKVMKMFCNEDISVAINLNVCDIYNRDMIKTIFHSLSEASHPESFVFELVESEEVTDYQYIKEFADRIHEHGAKIAIDDFGSGFSNLMHIVRINADYLKIDGEIVRMVCEDKSCREFIEIINDWCNRQKKDVIAEFVEDASIQEVIEQIGISHSQGYYFSKPEEWNTLKVKLQFTDSGLS